MAEEINPNDPEPKDVKKKGVLVRFQNWVPIGSGIIGSISAIGSAAAALFAYQQVSVSSEALVSADRNRSFIEMIESFETVCGFYRIPPGVTRYYSITNTKKKPIEATVYFEEASPTVATYKKTGFKPDEVFEALSVVSRKVQLLKIWLPENKANVVDEAYRLIFNDSSRTHEGEHADVIEMLTKETYCNVMVSFLMDWYRNPDKNTAPPTIDLIKYGDVSADQTGMVTLK